MKSFGIWLHESHLTLSEIVALRNVATTLAQNWPIGSNQRTDYETIISTHLPAAAQPGALQQLRSVWPVYELDAHGVGQAQVGTGFLGFITQLIGRTPQQSNTAAVLGIGVLIVATFVTILYKIKLTDLAEVNNARGLLTFLFGLTTVGIAIIVVLSVFLSIGTKEELAERFQRGKDILTVLIGVFGAILGFYFGTDKGATETKPLTSQIQQIPGGSPVLSLTRHRARSQGHRARSQGHRARSQGHRARSQGHRARSQGHRARSQGHRARSQGHRARSQGHRARSQGHRARSQGHRARSPSMISCRRRTSNCRRGTSSWKRKSRDCRPRPGLSRPATSCSRRPAISSAPPARRSSAATSSPSSSGCRTLRSSSMATPTMCRSERH